MGAVAVAMMEVEVVALVVEGGVGVRRRAVLLTS